MHDFSMHPVHFPQATRLLFFEETPFASRNFVNSFSDDDAHKWHVYSVSSPCALKIPVAAPQLPHNLDKQTVTKRRNVTVFQNKEKNSGAPMHSAAGHDSHVSKSSLSNFVPVSLRNAFHCRVHENIWVR